MKNIFFLSVLVVSLLIFGSFDSKYPKSFVTDSSVFMESQAKQVSKELFIVISDSVPMRSGPGSQFKAAKFLNKKAKVEVLNKEYGEWYVAKHKEVSGFVHKKYLKALKLKTLTID